MAKVLILYYSAYGHMERMAHAVAEGVRDAGVEADIKRVPELVPEEVAKQSGFKLDQKAPIATVAELADYDAIIFGSGTRFGVFTSQMRNFLDQTGPLWMKGALVGKVGSVFTGSGTQHGGQESTILSMIPTLLHHGMIVVGAPPLRTSILKTACYTSRPVSLLDTTLWTSSLAWGSGPKGEAPDYTGLDVVIVRDGKIAALYVFLN